jgi:hypothetical protein
VRHFLSANKDFLMIDTDIKLQWRLASQPAGTVDPLLGFFDRRQ